MRIRFPRLILAGLASIGLATSTPSLAPAQQPDNGVEVLARGPVHEAFAATLELQKDGATIVRKAPPEAIEELPPDQKPAGDNVQWLPGYWHWDEEREDFIWISGFWRVPPPGRVWVAGSWREVRGGYQWVHGFWQESRPQVRVQEVEYLSAPPAPIEIAPSIPAPSETHVYVPGSWIWRSHRYAWRPGYWVDHRPGWVWVPAHYRWTPAGHIFIDGYWDMPLAERGVLFAPVYVSPAVYSRPAFVYSPTIVVSEPALHTSLFVRRGWGCYYFGDYFENRYTSIGYSSWCSNVRGSGFGVSISVGRSVSYDPLWDYYRVAHRHDRRWAANVTEVYVGRFNGTVARPPRTLVQQNVIVNNVTNVTNVTNNNTTIVNNNINNTNTTVNNNQMMLTSLSNVAQTNKTIALKPIANDERVKEQQFAKELKQVSAQRKQLETSIADRGQAPTAAATAPKAVKLDVPKAAVARAQVATEKSKDVPPPAATLIGKTNPANAAANNANALKPAPLNATSPNTPNTPNTAALKPEMKPSLPPATVPSTKVESTKPNVGVPTPPATKNDPKTLPSPNVPSLKPNTNTVPAPAPLPSTKPNTNTIPAPAPLPSTKPNTIPAPAQPLPPPTVNKQPTPLPPPTTISKPAPAPMPAPQPLPSTKPAPVSKPPVPMTITSPQPTPAPIKSEPRPLPPTTTQAPVFKPSAPAPVQSFKPSTPAPVVTQPQPSFKPSAPAPAPSFKPSAPAPAPSFKPSAPPASTPSLKPSSPPPSNNKESKETKEKK